MISLINYGAGNIKSVDNILKALGYDPNITGNPNDLKKSEIIILPGVGAFPDCIEKLKNQKMIDELNEQVLVNKKPFLGICIGLQLLADQGYENTLTKGFGWINGDVIKIQGSSTARVPHMGWNSVKIKSKSGLFSNFHDDPTFYFVHSYYFKAKSEEHITSTCSHGQTMVSSVQKDNIYAVQFHPEKSQENGLKLLENLFTEVNY